MVHANSASPQTWFTENNETLSGRDDFLHIMEVEPTQQERLAQGIGVNFLQRSFKDFLPTSEPTKLGLSYLTTQTNRHITFFSGKFAERPTVFMSSRKMTY